jgi:hypothetical protein
VFGIDVDRLQGGLRLKFVVGGGLGWRVEPHLLIEYQARSNRITVSNRYDTRQCVHSASISGNGHHTGREAIQ